MVTKQEGNTKICFRIKPFRLTHKIFCSRFAGWENWWKKGCQEPRKAVKKGLLLNKSSLCKINRPPKPRSLVHAFLVLTLWITVGNNPCACLCVQQTMTKRSAHISPLNIRFWVPSVFRALVDDWKLADAAFYQIIFYETVHMQGRYQAQLLYRGLVNSFARTLPKKGVLQYRKIA